MEDRICVLALDLERVPVEDGVAEGSAEARAVLAKGPEEIEVPHRCTVEEPRHALVDIESWGVGGFGAEVGGDEGGGRGAELGEVGEDEGVGGELAEDCGMAAVGGVTSEEGLDEGAGVGEGAGGAGDEVDKVVLGLSAHIAGKWNRERTMVLLADSNSRILGMSAIS